jgi:hypothetical protein
MNNSAAWTLPDHQKRVLAIGDARRRGILRRMSPQFFALLFCAIGVWIAASAVGAAGAQLLSGSYRPVSTTQNNRSPFGIAHPRDGEARQGSNLPERALVLENNMKNQDAGAAAPATETAPDIERQIAGLDSLAMISLSEIYESYVARKFEDAISKLDGFTRLIEGRPGLEVLIADLKSMVDAELRITNAIRTVEGRQ